MTLLKYNKNVAYKIAVMKGKKTDLSATVSQDFYKAFD
jgi:hypothetical protein